MPNHIEIRQGDSFTILLQFKDRNNPINISDSSVLLYYPENGEKLWDIAKKYNSTSDSIISANDLKNTDDCSAKVLLIPKRSRKAPVFSKII